jgi:outer membrane immunogenic protein
MRKFLFATAVLIGGAFVPASGADLPGRGDPSPAIMVPTVFSWAGFYLGGLAQGRWSTVDDRTGASPAKSNGYVFGLIGGGNFQVGNFVFGVEGDGGSGSGTGNNFAAGGVIGSVDLEATGHIRGRVGYAFNNVLVFGAAGMVATDVEFRRTGFPTALKETVYGWTAGAGIDYAAWRSLILRVEYLYESYGDKSYVFSPAVQNTLSVNSHVVRGAAMFKF